MNSPNIAEQKRIDEFLAKHPHWQFENDALVTMFSLSDFATAMKVVESVARAAEELHHHPNWCNEYNKLTFSLTTHEAGNKVTDTDLELARAIESIIAAHTN